MKKLSKNFFDLLPNKEVVDMYEQLFILLDSTSIWYLILYLINIAVVRMMLNFKLYGYFGYFYSNSYPFSPF